MFEISTRAPSYYFNVEFFYGDKVLSGYFSDVKKNVYPKEILLALGLKMYGDVYSHTKGSFRGNFRMVGNYTIGELWALLNVGNLKTDVDYDTVKWIYSTLPQLKNNFLNYHQMGLLFCTDLSVELIIGETLSDTFIVVRKGIC